MNVLFGVLTMVVCLVLQAFVAGFAIRFYDRRDAIVSGGSFVSGLMVICSVMVLLLIGNFLQIGIWAVLFQALGEFDHLKDAFYHSAVNFATLGYGDIVMSEAHRMLGPLEAINGVLMIGVSTALLMSAFQDVAGKRRKHRSVS